MATVALILSTSILRQSRPATTTTGYSLRYPVSQDTLFSNVSVTSVKKFWDNKPCNSGWYFPGVQKGTREWFNRVEERRYIVEPHSVDFAGFFESSGLDVLEIGGGICTDSMSFAKNGANITVVDLSSESLKICRQRFELFGQRAFFFQGSAMELTTFLPVFHYDVIYSYGVIHHMPNPRRCFCQLQGYLKPGGELRVMLYTKFSYKLFQVMHEYGVWDISQLDSTIARYSEAQTGSPVTYTYTADEATEMLEYCGFTVEKIWKDHIFSYDLDKYRDGILEVLPEIQTMNPVTLQQMKQELGWHLMIKAKLA